MLALLFLVLTLQGTLLLGSRKRRFDVVVLVLGATQFALHNAFHFLPATDGGTHAGRGGGHGPQHHMAEASGDPGAAHAMDTGMILAHAAATLGSALCVLYGERVLRRLGALLAPRVVLRSASPLPCPPRSRPVPPVVVRIRFGALLARSRSRRGPPVAASA
ncbi:hypothetical protein ABZ362_26050 [Streptomyces sp. NPDC005951]|uniref:hypothetical protein n=1 Tax=Streptomyces sp. NPDC005951 TaxID=3154573 RepID=UPI0033CAF391